MINTGYSEIDRNIVINELGDGRFELRVWNEAGTECPRRGVFQSHTSAMAAGRDRLSYLEAQCKQ